MKTYWDFTERERAGLATEQVEKLLAYELMEQGVLQVEPLKLEDVEPVEIPKRRVFELLEANGYGGHTNLEIGFDTIEQAEACRNAIRYIREAPWNGVPHARPVRELQISAEELPTAEAATAQKAALDELKRRESANAEATQRFEEETKKVAEATARVWSDWHECRRTEARHQKIRDTLAEYSRMTEGDGPLSLAFLAKAFPAEEILAATGLTVPEASRPPPAPTPIKDQAGALEF